MGRKQTDVTRARISATMKARGITPSKECIAKGRAAQVGPKHPNWNPNKNVDAIDRMLFKQHLAPLVKRRDNFICALCRKTGGELHSHHIKPFSLCPELRFSFVNTLTICERCHSALHNRHGIEIHPQSKFLWDFLSSQLTSKTSSALETRVLLAMRCYRDILVANQGDISSAWGELEAAIGAYKEHHKYD